MHIKDFSRHFNECAFTPKIVTKFDISLASLEENVHKECT